MIRPRTKHCQDRNENHASILNTLMNSFLSKHTSFGSVGRGYVSLSLDILIYLLQLPTLHNSNHGSTAIFQQSISLNWSESWISSSPSSLLRLLVILRRIF